MRAQSILVLTTRACTLQSHALNRRTSAWRPFALLRRVVVRGKRTAQPLQLCVTTTTFVPETTVQLVSVRTRQALRARTIMLALHTRAMLLRVNAWKPRQSATTVTSAQRTSVILFLVAVTRR